MNGRDTRFRCLMRRIELHRLIIYAYLPAIRLVNAGEYFHNGGFACTVFTDEGGDGAGIESQGHL